LTERPARRSIWSDPQIDKHGKPTGDHYVTREDCGVEVLTPLRTAPTTGRLYLHSDCMKGHRDESDPV
jgi:hypothetical protein